MDNLSLTQTELEVFKTNGWIGPFDSGVDQDDIEYCHSMTQSVVETSRVNPIYGRHSVRDWHLIDDKILGLFQRDEITHRVKSILNGQPIKLWRSKIFSTPPKSKGIGWHQEWGHFNGEEIGNNIPALKPINYDDYWNLSIWVALTDITLESSPMQFLNKSHNHRYEIKMVPIVDSAFFVNPFDDIHDKEELLEKVTKSTLLLDINTTLLLEGVNCEAYSLSELKAMCWKKMQSYTAAVTMPFDTEENEKTVLLKRGQFIIFSERTMHRSLPNTTDLTRLAINCRMTPATTEVYPGKLEGNFIDGSNLDISKHRNVEFV